MSEDVLIGTEGRLGRITLNRPQALHALTQPMCRAMRDALLAWRADEAVTIVLIEHAPGTRGFCAGGDVRMLAESGAGDGAAARDFFRTEYQLNHLIHAFPKPVVALMDGVTMGGGVGLAGHATWRIATERTLFAMPEASIGLFPDVGGGWLLPRLPGEIGAWLAMTAARLKAADCLAAKIATHFTPSDSLDLLRVQIAEAADARDPAQALKLELDQLAEDPGPPTLLTGETREKIDLAFCQPSVSAILDALDADGSDWARAQLEAMRAKSPQTLHVSMRQLRAGKGMERFEEVMRMEYRIASRIVASHDFQEGVRAVLIDKTNDPRWRPPRVEDVDQARIDALFEPLPPEAEWSPAA